jgi:hypothetical protein
MELQKPQLPAALVAAGCRGHADALQLLLRHPELTATALQVCALLLLSGRVSVTVTWVRPGP